MIVSSVDLHEAHLLVSATGRADDCASLVFDVCLCAEGRDSNLYTTTVALVPTIEGRFRTDWRAMCKLPTTLSLALLTSTMGLVMQPWEFWGWSSSEMTRHGSGTRSGIE